MTALTEPWPGIFADALSGDFPCMVHGLAHAPQPLPVGSWRACADESDLVLLGHCVGPTLDVGCGPGRMSEHLARRGQPALGIDVVSEAVEQARRRGATALLRDVFDDLPGAGRWATVLLADGNIGIGGDPVRLLRRLRDLLATHGRVVVDLSPPGAGLSRRVLEIECGSRRSEPFAWAVVGPESLRALAAEAGFTVGGLHEYDGRWFAVLLKDVP